MKQERQLLAWRSATAAAILIILVQSTYAWLAWDAVGWSTTTQVRLAHVGLAMIILVILLISSPARRGLGLLSFYLLAATVLPSLWLADTERLDHGIQFTPFSAYKVAFLAIAILAPGPPALALGALALLMGQVLIQSQVIDYGPALEAAVEPWVTGTYALIAVILVLYRAHHRRVAFRAAQSSAEAAALSELTHFMLAVRDLYNTPIQNLEIDTALLARGHPPSPGAVRRMRNAVRQLRELRTLLTRYDHLADWDPEQHALDSKRAQDWLDRLGSSSQPRDRRSVR